LTSLLLLRYSYEYSLIHPLHSQTTVKMPNKPDLASDIEFIKTPEAQPSKFEVADVGVAVTNVSASPLI
jgi:hypothetical protein